MTTKKMVILTVVFVFLAVLSQSAHSIKSMSKDSGIPCQSL